MEEYNKTDGMDDMRESQPDQTEYVKDEATERKADGESLWDKAKKAAEEVKDAFDPNSGDPATRRDYR